MLWVSNERRYMMEKAGALVNVRDINLICRAYKTSARIEGVARRRTIMRARRSNGISYISVFE